MNGETLKNFRESLGMTQAQLAAWINEMTGRRYDKQRLSRWETEKEKMPREVLALLLYETMRRPASVKSTNAVITSFSNQKGGVGKTASSVNTAYILAKTGRRVLLVDADSQGNATTHCGFTTEQMVSLTQSEKTHYHALMGKTAVEWAIAPTGIEGLDILPSSVSLAMAERELYAVSAGADYYLRDMLQAVQERYDHIIIDCPPHLGRMTTNALAASQLVVIPCQTEPLSLMGLEMLYDTILMIKKRVNPRLQILGILPTLHRASTTQNKSSMEDLLALWGQTLAIFPPVPHSVVYPQAVGALTITLDYDKGAPGMEAMAEVARAMSAHETVSAKEVENA
mgnify:CR=1 FL=1